MIHIDVDLLVPLILLWVLPEIREGRVEQASADAVRIRHIIPLLLACIKYFGKVCPVRHVGLHVEDVVFVCGEGIEIGRGFEIGYKHFCTYGVRFLGESQTDACFYELISQEICDALLLTRCPSRDEQDFAVEWLIDGLHFENTAVYSSVTGN